MGTTYRFIESPLEQSQIIEWFRSEALDFQEIETKTGYILYFKNFGELIHTPDGKIDVRNSPTITIFTPKIIRGVLWSVGEIHFLSTPLKQKFPELHKLSSALNKWLGKLPCVYSNRPGVENEWNYYLEGSTKNYDAPIYAFRSGLNALKKEQYFISDSESEFVVEKLCNLLKLRGVEVTA